MDWARKVGGIPTWGWAAIVGGGALVVIIRRRQAAASSPTSSSGVSAAYGAAAIDPASGVPYSSELAQAQAQVPNAQATLPSGASYSGPASGLSQVLSELQPAQPAAAPSPAAPGYGTIEIGGSNPGQYIELGPAGGQVYQVGGGAPVYFGNANQVDQGGAAMTAASRTGSWAYTPIQYAPQVAPAPVQVGAGQF